MERAPVTEAIYQPGIHAGLGRDKLLALVRAAGWDPILIQDPPGYCYPPHRHAAAKLLAILAGSMEVTFGGNTHRCEPGDQVVIPGDTEHSALVGAEGCTFFWSEQIR
jgi:mannose-6-phosphate isomerase-like protein (cupin superfamily)